MAWIHFFLNSVFGNPPDQVHWHDEHWNDSHWHHNHWPQFTVIVVAGTRSRRTLVGVGRSILPFILP